MKKLLLLGSILLVLGLTIATFAIPIFAHGPDDGEGTPADETAWEAMHEACENGDWEAMTEAAEEVHGEDFDGMPYHDEEDHVHHWWGGSGHMGQGMMGW